MKTVEQLEQQIEWLCGFADARTGSCPGDMYSWEHPEGCENACEIEGYSIAKCWKLYSSEKSKNT